MFWLEPPSGRLGGVMDSQEMERFDAAIRDMLQASGLPWRELGDMVDAVTVCLNVPSKVPHDGQDGPAALTDRIGRLPGGSRYAWAGLLDGNEADSAYRAMSALFIQPKRAWLFDGYEKDGQFAKYDVRPAAEALQTHGLNVVTDDPARNGREVWRARARRGVEAELILVNSSGRRRSFKVPGGALSGGDVPMLHAPALVHFIHSFSAQNLSDDRSIAPRWLKAGAFVFVGAVHEPFLSAFQTPTSLVHRLLAPSPIGAAARFGDAPLWRINILGDPLYTIGKPVSPSEQTPELPGAESVETIMRKALKQGDLETGLAALVMLGRDRDVVRLLRAVIDQDDRQLSPAMARIAFPAAVRAGRRATIASVYAALPREAAQDPSVVDLLWQALRRGLQAGDERAISLLQDRLRDDSYVDDALAIAQAVRRSRGANAARAALIAYAKTAPSERARQRLTESLTER